LVALVWAARHPETVLEARDASLAARSPCSTAAEPSLSLVGDTLLRLVAGLWDDGALDAELTNAALTFAGVEAAVGAEVVNVFETPHRRDY
jgi:hypothetical protein